MSKSPYFEKLQAPGRGVYRVRQDLLAKLFAMESGKGDGESGPHAKTDP